MQLVLQQLGNNFRFQKVEVGGLLIYLLEGIQIGRYFLTSEPMIPSIIILAGFLDTS